jgi:hypothetical protein
VLPAGARGEGDGDAELLYMVPVRARDGGRRDRRRRGGSLSFNGGAAVSADVTARGRGSPQQRARGQSGRIWLRESEGCRGFNIEPARSWGIQRPWEGV